LDILANCVAVINQPGLADYMGFKYMSHFHRTWLTDPQITAPERTEVNAVLDTMVNKLEAADQIKAQQLRAKPKPQSYWFRPEYNSVEAIMKLCAVPIYQLYRLYCGPTHGGFAGKFMFDDDPHSEDIEPRKHPKNVRKAVVASTRLLVELCRVRDHWDNNGAGEEVYQGLVERIAALQ
jgi:hypothetical protein